jgi:hypothetical protein
MGVEDWLQGATPPKSKSSLIPCPDCSNPVSEWAASCPECGRRFAQVSTQGKYPALVAIAGIHRGLAIAIAALSLIGLVFVFASEAQTSVKVQMGVPLLVLLLLGPLFLWGTAELILLLIDIEKNTRDR